MFSGLFSLMFTLIFLLAAGIIVAAFVQGIHQWNKNNHSPRLTVDALVVTKRMDVSHRRHVNAGDHTGAHRYHTTTST